MWCFFANDRLIIERNFIFSKFIKTKGLSKDEFKIMTLDEVKEYMVDVINDITSFEPDELFTIVKNLEKLQ